MSRSVIVCSIPVPPDPVATTMQQEAVRHGETVFAEAGVSQAADGRWCRDTGIQLAAAAPDTPGSRVRPAHNLLALYNVCHHAVCLTLTMHGVMTRRICWAEAGLECPHPCGNLTHQHRVMHKMTAVQCSLWSPSMLAAHAHCLRLQLNSGKGLKWT